MAQQTAVVETKKLLKELEWTARFIQKKVTIPIIQTVRMQSTEGALTLTATDLENAGVSSVPVSGDTFDVCVSVTKLIKYLKKVEDLELLLSADGNNLTVLHGSDSEVTIDGLNSEAFPVLPDTLADAGTLSGLATALPRVLMSISHDESRFTLNGALLNARTDTACMVSTDGHRLSHASIQSTFTGKALISRFALGELARLVTDDAVLFATDENHVAFTVGNRRIISRKLTGNFPDYERVMPKPEHTVDIRVKDLAKVLDRVSLFADERSKAAVWNIEHAKLTVSASVTDSGKASGAIQLPTNGITWRSGFNSAYMIEGLKQFAEVARFQFSMPDVGKDGQRIGKAAQFATDGFVYVVMPIRI